MQDQQEAAGNLGPLVLIPGPEMNSCATHVLDVLRAGGVNVPRPEQLTRGAMSMASSKKPPLP
jgi:hypothetical protein